MRERTVEAAIREKVNALGGLFLKWVCPGHAGVPDRIVLLPGGRILFLELKAPGKKPTTLQAKWLEWLRKLGFRAEWADNAEEAMAMIVKTTEVHYVPDGKLEVRGVVSIDEAVAHIKEQLELNRMTGKPFRGTELIEWLESKR